MQERDKIIRNEFSYLELKELFETIRTVKQNNVVVDKSYAFGIRIVNCYKYLYTEKKEYVLSKQLVGSGTLIGANVEEAVGAQSKKDFIAKLSIAYKETRETNYRIRLLRDAKFIDVKMSKSLLADTEELLKLIGNIIKTVKRQQILNS